MTSRAFYRTGEEVTVRQLPEGTSRVVARADRATWRPMSPRAPDSPSLQWGSYSLQALEAGGELLAEELTTVGRHQGERPVHGSVDLFPRMGNPRRTRVAPGAAIHCRPGLRLDDELHRTAAP